MSDKRSHFFETRSVIGIIIIAIGAIILLENIGYELGVDLWDFWPVILIFIGLGQIMGGKESHRTTSGWVILVLGVLFLFNNLDFIDFGFGFAELWPIILIVIGIGVLRHSFLGKRMAPTESDSINLSFIIGGGEHRFNTSRLKGGKVTAIMGGGSIDLRQADMEEQEIIIDVFAFWGGIDLKIPDHWDVNIRASSILGGIDNKSSARFADSQPGAKTLILTGAAIMGGVELKN